MSRIWIYPLPQEGLVLEQNSHIFGLGDMYEVQTIIALLSDLTFQGHSRSCTWTWLGLGVPCIWEMTGDRAKLTKHLDYMSLGCKEHYHTVNPIKPFKVKITHVKISSIREMKDWNKKRVTIWTHEAYEWGIYIYRPIMPSKITFKSHQDHVCVHVLYFWNCWLYSITDRS